MTVGMSDLTDTLKQCVERMERFRRQPSRINELTTRIALIEPVLGALGWGLYDLEEVHREYKRRSNDNPVDYALLLLRTPRLFVEAKGLGENLDDLRWANQTISYATSAGVEWVALTNGAEWRIYNAHAPVPIEHKLFRAVRLEQDLEGAAEILSLLSKDNMRDNRIEELWRGYFIDRQVHRELLELFGSGEPAPELVAMLDRRLPRLTQDEIRSSLIRARATFDFPSSTAPFDAEEIRSAPVAQPALPPLEERQQVEPQRSGPGSPAVSGRRSRAKKQVSAAERKIKVIDMIEAGRLRPGSKLYAKYLGKQYVAELLADGAIRYRGRTLTSASAAGVAVKTDAHGPAISEERKSTDGLDFWSVEDAAVGDIVTLKEIRRRMADGDRSETTIDPRRDLGGPGR